MQMNDTEFDRIVRSVMENAEEEVPARVWSSVSRQIGRTGVVALNWKRIAGGAAAAAAIVAGVFIFGTTTINQTNTETDLVANQSVSNAADSPVAERIISAESAPALLAQAAPVSRAMDAEPVSMEEFIAGPQAEGRDAVSESNAEMGYGRASQTGENPVEGPVSNADPFAQMAYEDNLRPSRRGISFKVGGDVSTNSDATGLGYSVLSRKGNRNQSITQLSKESTYAVPVSFGVGVRIPLRDKWSLETGLTYSFLERTFTGIYKEIEGGMVVNTVNADIRNTLHYAGIPVTFNYDIVSGQKTLFYAYAGGAVEKAFINRYSIPSSGSTITYSESVSGVQLSAAAGIGVSFLVTDWLGIYIDPSLRYYFDCGQPVSIRTQQPFTMNLEMGFRFNLGR